MDAKTSTPGTTPPTLPKMDPEELSASAWERINEAMTGGSIFLPGGREITLGADNIMKLTQWLATLRTKRPKSVMKSEDYEPQVTKGKG